MTDTHTHLYLPEFDGDGGGGDAVARALEAGVGHLIFPNVDLESCGRLIDCHKANADVTSVASGLHPTSVDSGWRDQLEKIEDAFSSLSPKAIGEVGMDLYWDSTFRSEQMDAFLHQVLAAAERDLPVIIHCREALDDTLDVIARADREAGGLPKMIFHSFTGTPADVRRIRNVCDPAFGINGVVTFKNASGLREAVPEIGIDNILLETDSPYLSPVPLRGRRNESANIPLIAAKTAELLSLPIEEIEEITDSNAATIFRL